MALAKERGAYPIFRIHPIVYEFLFIYYFIFYHYTLLKAVEKVVDAKANRRPRTFSTCRRFADADAALSAAAFYSFTPNNNSP